MKIDTIWIIIFVLSVLGSFIAGARAQADYTFKQGYIGCLLDIQNNKPMKYVLKKQADGETRWVENKEIEE